MRSEIQMTLNFSSRFKHSHEFKLKSNPEKPVAYLSEAIAINKKITHACYFKM